MKSGFITKDEKIELKINELLAFATYYCEHYEKEKYQEYEAKHQLINPAFDYVIKVLKWIQVGSVSEGENSYLKAGLKDYMEIRELKSFNYQELIVQEEGLLSKISYLNKFKTYNADRAFEFANGFISGNGLVMTTKKYNHNELSVALANYLAIQNAEIAEIFSWYHISCYEDILTRLLGFIKMGYYDNNAILMLTPELMNSYQKQLIKDYEILGFYIDELKPIDISKSKRLIKSLKI